MTTRKIILKYEKSIFCKNMFFQVINNINFLSDYMLQNSIVIFLTS